VTSKDLYVINTIKYLYFYLKLDIRSVERGPTVPRPHYTCCDFDLLGSRDVISRDHFTHNMRLKYA